MTFDAGSIVATLELNRDPFQRGLDEARAEGEAFEKNAFSAKLDVDTSEADAKATETGTIYDVLRRNLQRGMNLNVDTGEADRAAVETGAVYDVLRRNLTRAIHLNVDTGTGSGAARGIGGAFSSLFSSISNFARKLTGGGDGGGGRGGLLGSIAGGFDGIVNSIGGLATAGTTFINPITIALGALIAIMTGPLMAAFLPITLGFGGLAAVAIPELTKVWNAVNNGGKAIKGLDPSEKALVPKIRDLKNQFADLANAIKPAVMSAFSSALNVIKDLMPALKPLITAAANALAGFFNHIDNWLKSPSGKKFLNWLETQGPKDIKTFGNILWDVAQGIGRTFDFLVNAGNSWWTNFHAAVGSIKDAANNLKQWLWNDFALKIANFFTNTLPTALDVFKEVVRVAFDKIKILAADMVLAITTTMGHLPGPLGAPFRAASASVRAFRNSAESDMKAAVANITGDISKLHGKNVALTFSLNLPAGVSYPSRHIKGRGAKGLRGAAAGTYLVGEDGPELAYLPQGTNVLPAKPTARIMGGLAGGTFNFTDAFHPAVGSFLGRLNSTFSAAEAAIISHVQNTAQLLGGISSLHGIPGGSGVAQWAGLVHKALAMEGLSPFLAGNVLYQMQTESGGNARAINLTDMNARMGDPSRGLMQVIMGTFRAYHWPGTAWNIFDPLANIAAALNYARHVYGATLQRGGMGIGSGHGYDKGGPVPPGATLLLNRTGRTEEVLTPEERRAFVDIAKGARTLGSAPAVAFYGDVNMEDRTHAELVGQRAAWALTTGGGLG